MRDIVSRILMRATKKLQGVRRKFSRPNTAIQCWVKLVRTHEGNWIERSERLLLCRQQKLSEGPRVNIHFQRLLLEPAHRNNGSDENKPNPSTRRGSLLLCIGNVLVVSADNTQMRRERRWLFCCVYLHYFHNPTRAINILEVKKYPASQQTKHVGAEGATCHEDSNG